MSAFQRGLSWIGPSKALPAGLLVVSAAVASACGGSTGAVGTSPSTTNAATSTTKAATSTTKATASTTKATAPTTACSVASRQHEVAVVVESSTPAAAGGQSSGAAVIRCLGLAKGTTMSALALLARAGIETATQHYSFGPAICQVDHVPAHYTKCLPSGAPYWALFVAPPSGAWAAATTGIGGIHVPAGGSLGLRYDPPTGTAPAPTVAPPLR